MCVFAFSKAAQIDLIICISDVKQMFFSSSGERMHNPIYCSGTARSVGCNTTHSPVAFPCISKQESKTVEHETDLILSSRCAFLSSSKRHLTLESGCINNRIAARPLILSAANSTHSDETFPCVS
eukprot:TRINITY_DN9221_c0_g1_i1.p1 TRINITY_DN9221_c0_g1~~TRINITY_DN9221_c0_g1_i1.p1  ORF type:complete len:125 (+),score=2.91 TRINITY_DN9221_c0_g1_i1:85-459(+)